MVSGSIATRRSLLQLCQAGCECIHYLVGSHHNSEQGLKVFVRITSWGRIPSLVLTVPDCPMYRVPRLGEHSGCGSCGRQVEMRRMYNRHTIYIRALAATFILFLCRNYTVAHIGLMSHLLVNPPTLHALPSAHIFTISVAPNYKF